MKSYAVTIDKWKQFEFNFFATISKIPKKYFSKWNETKCEKCYNLRLGKKIVWSVLYNLERVALTMKFMLYCLKIFPKIA